jgi:hypothetical protein
MTWLKTFCTQWALAALAAGGLAAAAAPAAAWQIGNWIGNPQYGRNGQFLGCRMSVNYQSGITLQFVQLRDARLFIGMSKTDWVMNPNGVYNMGLVIDGNYVRRARGTVLHGLTNAIFLDLGHDRQTRALLQRRFNLTLVNNQQNYAFNLTTTAAALERLESCSQSGA